MTQQTHTNRTAGQHIRLTITPQANKLQKNETTGRKHVCPSKVNQIRIADFINRVVGTRRWWGDGDETQQQILEN